MDQVRAQLTQIHAEMASRWNATRCLISDTNGFRVTPSLSLLDFLPTCFFNQFATATTKAKNRESWNHLTDIFGHQRIVTICRRAGIDFEAKDRHGLPLTRRDLSRIFLGLGHLHVDDVHTLFNFIVAPRAIA
jgi:hypothetical protein